MRAVIVGSSSGIGQAVKGLFNDAGWETVGFDRTHGVDVLDRKKYGEALLREFGGDNPHANALIYCAGHVEVGPLVDCDIESWDETIEVNLTGAFEALQLIGSSPVPSSAVLVASTAGTRPSPLWAAYSASKAALINLGMTANEEFPHVRVYVVSLGRCATPLRKRLAPDEDPETIMQPGEVAEMIFDLVVNDELGILSGSPIRVART